MGNPTNIQNLIASIGAVGAEEILYQDPSDRHEGFKELESWVDGSLDMYRPQFRPILFPIFCHFYLELIQNGFKDAALSFFNTFSPSLNPAHSATLMKLSKILLPIHVQKDDLAQSFRNVKYVVRMSRSGFSLLIGWLTEGIGGEALGVGTGFSGDKGKRGRSAVMRVVNNHLKFEVTSAASTSIKEDFWIQSTGLLSALIPQTSGTELTNPQTFNTSRGTLKLGPAPIDDELKMETERVIREQTFAQDPAAPFDLNSIRPSAPDLVSPTESDLLPHPPNFRSYEIDRMVMSAQDNRKRIRLDPAVLKNVSPTSAQANDLRARALPSICAYTLHDVSEGSPCSTFSEDTSLMAAGFAESYIRLWNLKGEKLRGLKSDLPLNSVHDAQSLRKYREKKVYSVSFDPLHGSSAPPKYLLSGSADATARLWSMDTYTNLVVYRGHESPVWDVKWNPTGLYFATASRDRTARLWSTDRASCLRIYAGHLNDVDALAFHPNSLYLATASSDWTARLWDVQRGKCLRVFIGHQGGLSSLAMSPDGRYLATAAEDLTINLWDLGSGRRIKKMTGHTASIYSLAFSAESSILVSGGADWTVRCWDVQSAGGLAVKTSGDDESMETTDLLSTFPTKRTPITNLQFTSRNLCLSAGYYIPESR
ncbi:TFIID and SAGA subunit [Flagelloscypha sp. PMI_526]|nr:TFIID and SAGA subunit [Flagelloscypha sp. PMI_526]